MTDGLHGTDFDSFDMRPKRKQRRHNLDAEWRLQARCVTWLKKQQRRDKNLRFIAPQPEAPRDVKRAAMAKMLGLQRGVADIIVMRRTLGSLSTWKLRVDWIELKRPDGRMSDEQWAWQDWFANTPIRCHVVTSLDEFKAVIK